MSFMEIEFNASILIFFAFAQGSSLVVAWPLLKNIIAIINTAFRMMINFGSSLYVLFFILVVCANS